MKKKKNKQKVAICLLIVSFVAVIFCIYGFLKVNEPRNIRIIGDVLVTYIEPYRETSIDVKPGKTYFYDPNIIAMKGNSYFRLRVSFYDKNGKLITDDKTLNKIKKVIYYDKAYKSDFYNINVNSSYTEKELLYLVNSNKLYSFYNKDEFMLEGNNSSNGEFVFIYIGNDGVIKVGDKVTLFTNVVIPSDMVYYDDIKGFTIEVKVDVVSTDGYSSSSDAFKKLD